MNLVRNTIFLFLTLLISKGFPKEPKQIHRCMMENGTISYQEQSCKKTKSNKKNNIKKSINSALSYVSSIQYKSVSEISSDNNSSQIISEIVKNYQISLKALLNWKIFKKVYDNKFLHIRLLDSDISLKIDFIYPDNKQFNEQELIELLQLSASRYVKGSREGSVNLNVFNLSSGKAITATLTNSKAIKDYKIITKGIIFKSDWLIQFTLLSNNTNSNSYKFAMDSLLTSLTLRKL
ncbi:MAG: hypothetical protein R3F25_00955 [Gammaproteobacteria bacterium]|nr:hypothetical protein [Xanthomonadales bacterium]